MRRLLDIVEEEIGAYGEGRAPDIDRLRLIGEYTLHYPALVHHPKEDLVFGRLAMRDPRAREIVGDLIGEHRQLAELTRRFTATMGAAAHDVALPRERLMSLAAEYLLAHRLHMQTEEKHFLPRAKSFLTDDDWADLDAYAAYIDDPLFGEKIADAYLFLYERILALRD